MKKETTLALYKRALEKIEVKDITDLQDTKHIIDKINALSSDSYKILAYRAINNLYIENNILIDEIYQKEYRQLQNIIDDEKDNVGTLPMTLEKLLNIEVNCKNPLRRLVESFTIYINTHYPLRLDYYNVPINPRIENLSCLNSLSSKENCTNYGSTPSETLVANYMIYIDSVLTFYLNDFKNVRSFGPQVITYSDPIICNYIQELTLHFGYTPKYLLYRFDIPTCTLQLFSSREMYGGYLKELFKRHTGHHITMNTIRKIHESDLIQSEKYNKMSNVEKRIMHKRLLHSLQTAHKSYNVVSSNV